MQYDDFMTRKITPNFPFRYVKLSQPSQPLPGILHLSYLWISVLPEGEEFLVVLDGFCCVAFPLDL